MLLLFPDDPVDTTLYVCIKIVPTHDVHLMFIYTIPSRNNKCYFLNSISGHKLNARIIIYNFVNM